jgi:hypothetical protein
MTYDTSRTDSDREYHDLAYLFRIGTRLSDENLHVLHEHAQAMRNYLLVKKVEREQKKRRRASS